MVPPIQHPWWILCRSPGPGTKDANLERHHAREEGRNGSGKAVLDIPETGEARMDKKNTMPILSSLWWWLLCTIVTIIHHLMMILYVYLYTNVFSLAEFKRSCWLDIVNDTFKNLKAQHFEWMSHGNGKNTCWEHSFMWNMISVSHMSLRTNTPTTPR